ncbi:hypothetical protein Droror1_Dr00022468 [Drosera rotundifolia]
MFLVQQASPRLRPRYSAATIALPLAGSFCHRVPHRPLSPPPPYSPSRAAITTVALLVSDHQQRTSLDRAMGFAGEEIVGQRVFHGWLERDAGHAKGAARLASTGRRGAIFFHWVRQLGVSS